MASQARHLPVLFQEALDALNIRPSGLYVDGTFGRGGHSGAILQALGADGRLLAIDKDPEAVRHARELFDKEIRFEIRQGSFAELERIGREAGIDGRVDGLLLDLGVSSPQLDQAERGFSFLHDGPLDMRMDNSSGISAAEWLEQAGADEMADIFKRYGEERYARRIARAIVEARKSAPITTTGRLAEIISAAHPAWEKGRHPATRCFQAIRIHVNRELEDLKSCLQQSLQVLAPGGRLVVISFHSLEDRIVKRFMRDQARGDAIPAGIPVTEAQRNSRLRLVGKVQKPSAAEIRLNPRARSAVLRVAERTA